MFQSQALRGLLLFAITASIVTAEVFVDDDIQAVVIQANTKGETRSGRQWGFPFQTLGVPASNSRSCMTAQGKAGMCASYRNCYPYYFTPSHVPSWVFGSNDACTYSDEKSSYTGTCCVTSNAQKLRQHWGAMSWPPQAASWPPQAGRQAQRQWGAPGGIYPAGTIPGAFFPGGGGPGGLYPGGGMPGGGIPGGLYPGGGMYPQRPQRPQYPQHQIPQIPQQPHRPKPLPPQVQIPQLPGIQQPQPKPPRPQPQPEPEPKPQPQPQPKPQPTKPAVVDVVDTGSSKPVNSACGIGGKAIVYDDNGEDEEAVQRGNSEFRIKGGWPAEKHEWPWIASIWNNGRQFCGGSLISPNHILTAAHCIDHMRASDVPRLQVKLGDHDINSKTDAITTDVGVANIIKHKGFSQRTLHNDVAILKLSSSVTYTKTVRPVCMAPYGANVPGDTTATVVGWGMLSHVGPRPDILQEITFKTWSNQRCSSTYGSNAPGGITDHMLCAGQKGQDSCMGDSGGPMVRAKGSAYEQIGIVSWGIACGKEHFPGVYTRVGKMRQWIDRVLAKY